MQLLPNALTPGEMFWRQLKFEEFDVSEMSIASLTIATSHGPTPWVALPVFTERRFFHTGILVRRDAGIASPADLRDRAVGVPEYQQTAVCWIRGILEHRLRRVDWRTFSWFMERSPERSHGGATGFRPPARFAYVAPDDSLAEMMLDGRIDATLFYSVRNTILDRRTIDLATDPRIFRPLFPDAVAEGRRYYAETHTFPINHCVIVRRSLVAEHPELARNLYDAFAAAKTTMHARAASLAAPHAETGGLAPHALDGDPLAYGVRANRATLETIATYLHEQALTERVVALDELFAPATLEV